MIDGTFLFFNIAMDYKNLSPAIARNKFFIIISAYLIAKALSIFDSPYTFLALAVATCICAVACFCQIHTLITHKNLTITKAICNGDTLLTIFFLAAMVILTSTY